MKNTPRTAPRLVESPNPVGSFAVMRQTERCARFAAIHDTKESAIAEAERLVAESIAKHGPDRTMYYVIEILGRIGIADGKLIGMR